MLDNIVLFTQLVENGSYSKTAEKLNISPSTLTRKIQDLESHLNQLLMIRDTRNFKLTEYGESLFNNFKDLRHRLDRFVISMNPVRDYSKGELNISLPIVRSINMISPYLGYFNKKHPNIILNILYQYTTPDIKHGLIDIAVTQHKIKSNKTYNSEFLRNESGKLYCTPDYVKKYGLPLNMEDLSNHAVIGGIDANEMPVNYVRFQNIFTKEEVMFDSSNTTKVNNPLHALEIGLFGEHIFHSWSYQCDNLVRQGKLVQVLPEFIAYQADLYVIYRKNMQAREALFVDFIRKCANGTIDTTLD